MSYEVRTRVVSLWKRGWPVSSIRSRLEDECIVVSKLAIYSLIAKYEKTERVIDLPKAPRSKILSEEHYRFIDDTMAESKDLTARQLHTLFVEKYPGIEVSISTIKRARFELGWVSKRVRYCQLIREVNKEKRKIWCEDQISGGDLEFDNVIFTDECTVELQSTRKVVFHKIGQPPPLVPKPKHPQKIHVWGGISAKGATAIVMFTGIMNATRYTDILDAALIPFIRDHYTHHHRFQQDNDPKHTSRWAQNYFETKEINWWRTPPSSPDLNPIENIWGSMKEYLRRVVKPHNTEELKAGIREFWKTLTPEVCRKYVRHLRKVIP